MYEESLMTQSFPIDNGSNEFNSPYLIGIFIHLIYLQTSNGVQFNSKEKKWWWEKEKLNSR